MSFREDVPHVCDCDDCSPEPFVDRCKYEAERDRYKAALEAARLDLLSAGRRFAALGQPNMALLMAENAEQAREALEGPADA